MGTRVNSFPTSPAAPTNGGQEAILVSAGPAITSTVAANSTERDRAAGPPMAFRAASTRLAHPTSSSKGGLALLRTRVQPAVTPTVPPNRIAWALALGPATDSVAKHARV